MKLTEIFRGAAERYRRDYEYRTVLSALVASLASAAAGSYHLFLALSAEQGVWGYTLAGYYFTLAFSRVALLLLHRAGIARREDEERRARRDAVNYLLGGILLVLLSLAYSGVIVLVSVKQYHFEYRGNMVYAMAAYAFYKIIASVVNGIKYRKYNDLTVLTFRNINIADGVVSIIALQSALLYAFSAESASFASSMNSWIGGAAGAVILSLGLCMAIRGISVLRGRREK